MRTPAVYFVLALALAVGLVLGPTLPALADDSQQGSGQVTISVHVSDFDPCSVGSPACGGDIGDLATTGGSPPLALAIGAILVSLGLILTVTRRLRKNKAPR